MYTIQPGILTQQPSRQHTTQRLSTSQETVTSTYVPRQPVVTLPSHGNLIPPPTTWVKAGHLCFITCSVQKIPTYKCLSYGIFETQTNPSGNPQFWTLLCLGSLIYVLCKYSNSFIYDFHKYLITTCLRLLLLYIYSTCRLFFLGPLMVSPSPWWCKQDFSMMPMIRDSSCPLVSHDALVVIGQVDEQHMD